MFRLSVLPLLLIGTTMPAFALDFGNGFSTTGEFELEYSNRTDSLSDTLGYAKFDIAYENASGFGGFVGVDAFNGFSQNELAGYGALSYSGSFGKIQIGAPRAAMDDYIAVPEFGGSRAFDLTLGIATDSYVTNANLLGDSETPLGLRYDGTFGDTKLGVSYHKVDDVNVLGMGANYSFGQVTLRGGLEHVETGGFKQTNYSLGAEGAVGPVTTGVLFTKYNAFAVDSRLAQLYAVYSPIDRLNLTGNVIMIDDTSFRSGYGLSAQYTLPQGAYVEAGIGDGAKLSREYNLSLGLKF